MDISDRGDKIRIRTDNEKLNFIINKLNKTNLVDIEIIKGYF